MEITDFLFEIKKSFLCESPFQILLTNLNSNLKGFFMPKVPKCQRGAGRPRGGDGHEKKSRKYLQ